MIKYYKRLNVGEFASPDDEYRCWSGAWAKVGHLLGSERCGYKITNNHYPVRRLMPNKRYKKVSNEMP